MDCDYERTLSDGRAGFAAFLDAIESFLASTKTPPDVTTKIIIVLDELVTNILAHGSADIVTVCLRVGKDALTVDLTDDGAAFDPLSLPEPDTSLSLEDRPIGGLGRHIVRTLMDRVDYSRPVEIGRGLCRERVWQDG